MDAQFYLDKLANREIKPTAIRILVLKALWKAEQAVSLLDLEKRLDSVDKSTLFRTISLFLSHHLIHRIDDGSGSLKYALCEDACECEVDDLHSHFYCEHCQKTYCFENIQAPVVKIPAGFTLQSINY
ncbi:MAG: transcriptional repressor, partial [Candidatus Symbiothrix sp.]|nr:transcriptional repressor [Candidatus Symbiothrix sp.]